MKPTPLWPPKPEWVLTGVWAHTVEDVLREVSWTMHRNGFWPTAGELERAFLRRERWMSTALGGGWASPEADHMLSEEPKAVVVLCVLKNPVEWRATDGKPVQFVLAHATTRRGSGLLLRGLAPFFRHFGEIMRNAEIQRALIEAGSPVQVARLLRQYL